MSVKIVGLSRVLAVVCRLLGARGRDRLAFLCVSSIYVDASLSYAHIVDFRGPPSYFWIPSVHGMLLAYTSSSILVLVARTPPTRRRCVVTPFVHLSTPDHLSSCRLSNHPVVGGYPRVKSSLFCASLFILPRAVYGTRSWAWTVVKWMELVVLRFRDDERASYMRIYPPIPRLNRSLARTRTPSGFTSSWCV